MAKKAKVVTVVESVSQDSSLVLEGAVSASTRQTFELLLTAWEAKYGVGAQGTRLNGHNSVRSALSNRLLFADPQFSYAEAAELLANYLLHNINSIPVKKVLGADGKTSYVFPKAHAARALRDLLHRSIDAIADGVSRRPVVAPQVAVGNITVSVGATVH